MLPVPSATFYRGSETSVTCISGILRTYLCTDPESAALVFSTGRYPSMSLFPSGTTGSLCEREYVQTRSAQDQPRYKLLPEWPIAFSEEWILVSAIPPYEVARTTILSARILQQRRTSLFFFSPVLSEDFIFRDRVYASLRKNLKVGELAQELGICYTRLIHLFHRVFETSPKEFIDTYKKEQLLHELTCGIKPLKTLPFEYGFGSYSALTRFCIAHLGAKPTDIRSDRFYYVRNIENE